MTIPIYLPAHLAHAEELVKLGRALGVEVVLYCNSAAARDGAQMRGLPVASSGENVGFGRAANLSAAGKDFDWLVVCNDDLTVVSPDFAQYIRILHDLQPTVCWVVGLSDSDSRRDYKIPGVAGVFTNLSLLQAVHLGILSRIGSKKRLTAKTQSNRGLAELRRGDAFPFICVAISRSAWNALEGFDPRFDLYFEDMDMLIRTSNLDDAHIAVLPARLKHVGSASTHDLLDASLPVMAWSAYQYLAIHTSLSPVTARIVVVTAMVLRLVFVPAATNSPKVPHVVGIAKAIAAVLFNRRPRLPLWQS